MRRLQFTGQKMRGLTSAAQPQPYVCIYASQVAMCIGANKHKKISEAVELMWHRVAPASFEAAMKRNTMRTEEEIADDIIRSHAQVRGLVDRTLAAACDTSDQVAKQYDTVSRELQAVPLPEEDRRLVEDVLKRNLYTAYGNTQEHRVLTYVRDTLGIKCCEDPTFYKRQQGTCTGPWGSFPWFVGGKIDAISEDRALLLEIKNRVNRLFYRVPFYEAVQVQAYLHLLDIERGVLVECLKTKPPPEEASKEAPPEGTEGAEIDGKPADEPAFNSEFHVNVIPVHRDRELWTREIVPKLEGFVDFLARLLDDPGQQDRYLQSKRRSAMVTSHINNWLKFRR